MRKRLISIIIAICMFFCMSIDAFAVPTVSYGYAGINNYSYAYAPAAASNLSNFGILDTRTIAHTGQLIPVT